MGNKAGATHPEPDYNTAGNGNRKGKNVPVKYRKLRANSSTTANRG